MGDICETDPYACLQTLIAIIQKQKQSIYAPAVPDNSLTTAPDHILSAFHLPSFLSESAPVYLVALRCRVMWLMGEGAGQGSRILLLEKDDLLWSFVPDWSRGALLIRPRLLMTAAAFTCSFLLLPALGSAAAVLPGPSLGFAVVIGSSGVEMGRAAPSFLRASSSECWRRSKDD